MISLTCGIKKEMMQMNLRMKQRLADLENELMDVGGGGQRES